MQQSKSMPIQTTSVSQEASQLGFLVNAAEVQIAASHQKYLTSKHAAEQLKSEETRAPQKVLQDLISRFKDKAMELAIRDEVCPWTPVTTRWEPSGVSVSDEGLILAWDVNGGYAPTVFIAAWARLLAN